MSLAGLIRGALPTSGRGGGQCGADEAKILERRAITAECFPGLAEAVLVCISDGAYEIVGIPR